MSDLRNRPGSFPSSNEQGHDSTALSSFLNQNTMDKKVADDVLVTGLDLNSDNGIIGGSSNNSQKITNAPAETNVGSFAREIQFFGRSINIVVLVTHFNIFLYSCSFWIQNAVFPYISKQLGADPVMFGYLQTVFALVQLAGGPLFGRFGDLFGSRLAMMLAFTASAFSYLFLYISTSIPLLFLSRLPSVFMHAMQGGQMIVTDVCDSKQRAAALAKLGLSYGVGMVIGPLLGGLLSKYLGLEGGALVACLLSICSVFSIYVSVPAQLKKTKTDTSKDSVFSLKKIGELMKAPGAAFLLAIKLGTGMPIGIFQSMFSIIALEIFKLPADQNSYMMSYIGIMAMIVQGFGVGPVSKRFSELTILTGSAALLCVSYLFLSFVTTITEMCIVFIPMVTGLTLQNVLTTSALTHTVPDADTGAMLGLNMAVNSFIRTISPTIGGYMLGSIGFYSFGYMGFVTSGIVMTILLFKMRH